MAADANIDPMDKTNINGSAVCDWEPPEDFKAIEALMRCLALKAEGKPYDENEFLYAVMLASTATLVNRGLDVDMAIAAVESAMQHGNIHLSYSQAEGLSLTIGDDT